MFFKVLSILIICEFDLSNLTKIHGKNKRIVKPRFDKPELNYVLGKRGFMWHISMIKTRHSSKKNCVRNYQRKTIKNTRYKLNSIL